jgi:hypothetical protein
MSTLADELHVDLRDHFPKGAPLSAIVEWLGSSKDEIHAALGELMQDGRAFALGRKYYHSSHPRAPAFITHRDRILDALAQGNSEIGTARLLGISPNIVADVRRQKQRASA